MKEIKYVFIEIDDGKPDKKRVKEINEDINNGFFIDETYFSQYGDFIMHVLMKYDSSFDEICREE